MTIPEFAALVADTDDLHITGINTQDEIVVKGPLGTYALVVSAVLQGEWADIGPFLLGQRPATVMSQFTRICGYFSRLSNWNASKIAELHDRHKGDYTLGETQ